jgi:HSP20 family protein
MMVFRYRDFSYPIRQLRHEMDRLLTGFVRSPEAPWAGLRRGQPAVNVWEDADTLKIELEVPGVRSDQVDISVVGGELALKIQRPEVKQEGVTYHRRERPVGSFTRVLRLPTEVEPDRVEAELRDGVLTISLPKAERAKPRKIEVSVT